MDFRNFSPGLKYGAKIKMDDLGFGTVDYVINAAAATGSFALTSGSYILGNYIIESTGSATLYPVALSQSSGVVSWSMPQVYAGSVTYRCIYLKPISD